MTWKGAWPSHPLQESRRKLTHLRETISESATDVSDDISSALSRFLVVRAAGHLEFTFEETLCCIADSQASPKIAGFVRAGFFKGRNPSPAKLVDTVRKFDKQKANDLDCYLQDDDSFRQRELDFLVNRRNLIAHGQSEGVGLQKALSLADLSIEVGDWIVVELGPAKF